MSYDIVPGEFCASYWSTYVVPGSKPGTTYVVVWNGGEEAPHCTCKAWEFAPWDEKQCKHTQQVWSEGCFWNCQWFEGNPDVKLRGEVYSSNVIPNSECENCGGPLVAVRIAV